MSPLKMHPELELDRCPHCRVARPSLGQIWNAGQDHSKTNTRHWSTYVCRTCGGVVLCGGPADSGLVVTEIYPSASEASADIPDRARYYLQQAIDTLHAPAGSVMLAASAVDAMLKAKGRKTAHCMRESTRQRLSIS